MIKNVLAATAAAGLLFAPIAAQAGTRASDSRVSLASTSSIDRASSRIGTAEAQAEDGIPNWLLVLLFAAAGVGIFYAVESNENNKSPGT